MSEFVGYTFCEQVADDSVVTRKMGRIIASGQTRYQRYAIWESPSQGVCVTIDGDLQSTDLDRATYHEALVHPPMLLHRGPRRVLICGGGTGVTAREVLRYPGVEAAIMVDIDREFVAACRTHLPWWHTGVFEDPRLDVRYEDIFDYVDRTRGRFDVILGDLTDVVGEIAPGRSFHSPAFYASLRRLLNPGGFLCTQASALSLLDSDNHVLIRQAITTQFPAVLSYRAHHDSFFAPWSFVLAGSSPFPGRPDLLARFRQGFHRHGLALAHFDPESLAACFALNLRIRKRLDGDTGEGEDGMEVEEKSARAQQAQPGVGDAAA